MLFLFLGISGALAQQDAVPAQPLGTAVCTSCHQDLAGHWAHTVHARVFLGNPRNDLEASGCEACHGPGSAHLQNPADTAALLRFSRKSVQPVARMNGACLQCHQGGVLIHWIGSVHERNELACSDCHNPMAVFSPDRLLARDGINETCFDCHQEQRAQFRRRSHMPMAQGKISCIDCHNPHGSTTTALLKTDTINDTCYQCHAEKRGPFIFEHAPVQENCLNCHTPHGSNHEKLLLTARPLLCQQCHTSNGHMNEMFSRANLASGSDPQARLMGRSCQNCHVAIHGSNHPSGTKFHR